MKIYKYPERNKWNEILARPVFDMQSLESAVSNILKDVKENGDEAVKKYSLLFDKIVPENLEVTGDEIDNSGSHISSELKAAILLAKKNIETFHSAQLKPFEVIETMTGVFCWRKNVAIEKIGMYIPGGTAPLFSSVLMLGIPARLAGCGEIIICSPPDANGNLHPAILFAAKLIGATKVFKVGGVQAIAAMTFGTKLIPAVYKIVGPGNQYVMCAKQLVQKEGMAIDMPAGPSEVAVYADDTADPAFVAADLLSQAEHGADSQVLLVTNSEQLIQKVEKEISSQLEKLPRKNIAAQVMENSKAVLMADDLDSIELLNAYAPEHLILACEQYDFLATKVVNAGSVFLGNYSPESAGDYASGTNHVLPTNGYARSYSGVSIDSFVKKITFQRLTSEGLNEIGKAVKLMAEAEGLHAHANAISVRLKK